VTILGAGNVGQQAAMTAAKLGAHVTVLDTNFNKLQQLDALGLHNVTSLILTEEFLKEILPQTDLLIACIQVADKKTPRLITPEMVKTMRPGSVIVDVDIDLGGSVETCKVTTLENPVFILHDVVHYCVSNITSAVPRIASRALSAAIMPYILTIADKGLEKAVLDDPYLAGGLSVYKGYVVKQSLAEIADLPLADLRQKIKDLNPGDDA
jgi:alanine dehydrogenase